MKLRWCQLAGTARDTSITAKQMAVQLAQPVLSGRRLKGDRRVTLCQRRTDVAVVRKREDDVNWCTEATVLIVPTFVRNGAGE